MGATLLLTHRIPYPPDKGEKIRSWRYLQHFAALGPVRLGCLVDDAVDAAHVPTLRGVCEDVCAVSLTPAMARLRSLSALFSGDPLTVRYFHNRRLADWFREQAAREDVARVFIFSSGVGPYLDAAPNIPAGTPVVVDFVDVDSDKWRQYADATPPPMGWIYRREARTLSAYESRLAARADASIFVSEAEAACFAERPDVDGARVWAAASGVDVDAYSPEAFPSADGGEGGLAAAATEGLRPGPADIVFTGAMNYRPNIDAVVWFTEKVLPRVRRDKPEARFIIVGSNPDARVLALTTTPGVVVTGRVPMVQPYLAAAAVAVAVLRLARGLQNKVLEAMAMARAVVATPQAHEGLDAAPDVEILVRADPDGFAQAVTWMLRDPAARARIGRAAREAIVTRWSWAARLKELDAALAAADARAARRRTAQSDPAAPWRAMGDAA